MRMSSPVPTIEFWVSNKIKTRRFRLGHIIMKYLKCMACRCSAFKGSPLRLRNSWLWIKTGVKKVKCKQSSDSARLIRVVHLISFNQVSCLDTFPSCSSVASLYCDLLVPRRKLWWSIMFLSKLFCQCSKMSLPIQEYPDWCSKY